jgi:hypothetical protein
MQWVKGKSKMLAERRMQIRQRVIDSFSEIVLTELLIPTVEYLAEKSNVGVLQVQELLEEEYANQIARCNLLTDKVISCIYREAINGNTASQRLWLQYIMRWAAPKSGNQDAKIPQVNITFSGLENDKTHESLSNESVS